MQGDDNNTSRELQVHLHRLWRIEPISNELCVQSYESMNMYLSIYKHYILLLARSFLIYFQAYPVILADSRLVHFNHNLEHL